MADDVFFLHNPTPQTLTWYQYYWNIFKRFGAESWSTWRFEMFASLVIGFCSFLYARAILGDQGAWDTFKIVFLSTVSGLGLMGIWHLIRTPWLIEQDREKTERGRFSSGVFGLLLFAGIVLGGAWGLVHLYRADQSLRTENRKLAKDNAELKSRPAEVKIITPEPPREPHDSLRRRTLQLADALDDFLRARLDAHPAAPNYSNQSPDDTEKGKRQAWEQYQTDTSKLYEKRYKQKALDLIREYASKGATTWNLELAFDRGPQFVEPGSMWWASPQDAMFLFRELAYHVDASDRDIHLDY